MPYLKLILGPGRMVEQLRALNALPEKPGLISSIYMEVYNHSSPWVPKVLFQSLPAQGMQVVHKIHVVKISIHVK